MRVWCVHVCVWCACVVCVVCGVWCVVCACACVCVCSCKMPNTWRIYSAILRLIASGSLLFTQYINWADCNWKNFINYEFFCHRSACTPGAQHGKITKDDHGNTATPPIVQFTTCSDHTTQYVKPTANTLCPVGPCLTLSEYAQQTHHYLTSNTTLLPPALGPCPQCKWQ